MGERLSIEEAAAALERSSSTLTRWIREGRIAVVRVLGHTYVTRAEVDRVKSGEDIPARPAPANGAPAPRKKARR